MGVTAQWYDEEQSVISYEFTGVWTWDEYESARQTCRQLLDDVDYAVDQVYDFSAAPLLPDGILSKFWHVASTKHENTSGLIVVVGQNRLYEMLTNTIGSVIKKTIRHFDISYITTGDYIDVKIAERRKYHRTLKAS